MTLMTRQLIASVTSEKQPQKGQDHRSSGNFSTQGFPEGTKTLAWEIEGGGETDIIKFQVKEDVSGKDPVLFVEVYSGNRTAVKTSRSLYIADPVGATSSFIVHVYAIY